MPHFTLNANLYARPAGLVDGNPLSLREVKLDTLASDRPQAIFDAYLPVTFEQALEAMQRLPQMDAEPDGFFVFSGNVDGARWQIDGHLFDFNDRLHRVQLSGACPVDSLDALLACYARPEVGLVFELVHEGVLLDETNFRRWAGAVSA